MRSYWNENRIDYLNIGLILLSLVLAFVLPFELFLFSYAVLGPLHYLTEIPWLHSKEYFVGRAKGMPGYVTVCVFGTAALLFAHPVADALSLVLVPLTFFGAFVLVGMESRLWRGVSFSLLLALCAWLLFARIELVLFTLFIPTVIHVFVFTAVFMLYGAMKRGKASGYGSVVALVAAAVVIVVAGDMGDVRGVSDAVRGPMESFVGLQEAVMGVLGSLSLTSWTGPVTQAVYDSSAGLMAMRFLAFAYTYHYLNWFTKTSIIGWHKVAVWKWIIIGVLWFGSVVLYAVDYAAGLRALFFLSFLHVLLEFPLNWYSFIGVVIEVGKSAIKNSNKA